MVFPAGSIDIMSVPEDVAEQQKRLKPEVIVAQYMYDRVSQPTASLHPPSKVQLLF